MENRSETLGTLNAGEAIGQYQRIKVHTDGSIMLAAVTDPACGYALLPAAVGARVSVRLFRNWHRGISSAAIALGAPIFPAALGKWGTASVSANTRKGVCVSAATVANQEFMYVLDEDK